MGQGLQMAGHGPAICQIDPLPKIRRSTATPDQKGVLLRLSVRGCVSDNGAILDAPITRLAVPTVEALAVEALAVEDLPESGLFERLYPLPQATRPGHPTSTHSNH